MAHLCKACTWCQPRLKQPQPPFAPCKAKPHLHAVSLYRAPHSASGAACQSPRAPPQSPQQPPLAGRAACLGAHHMHICSRIHIALTQGHQSISPKGPLLAIASSCLLLATGGGGAHLLHQSYTQGVTARHCFMLPVVSSAKDR